MGCQSLRCAGSWLASFNVDGDSLPVLTWCYAPLGKTQSLTRLHSMDEMLHGPIGKVLMCQLTDKLRALCRVHMYRPDLTI